MLRRGKPGGDGLILYFTDDSDGRYNFSGPWSQGQRDGRGETHWRNGNKYIGHYSKDKEDGRGKIL